MEGKQYGGPVYGTKIWRNNKLVKKTPFYRSPLTHIMLLSHFTCCCISEGHPLSAEWRYILATSKLATRCMYPSSHTRVDFCYDYKLPTDKIYKTGHFCRINRIRCFIFHTLICIIEIGIFLFLFITCTKIPNPILFPLGSEGVRQSEFPLP